MGALILKKVLKSPKTARCRPNCEQCFWEELLAWGVCRAQESLGGLSGTITASLSKRPPWASSVSPGREERTRSAGAGLSSGSGTHVAGTRGGRKELRGSSSSGPASPWCSTACAGWTGWWRRRVSAGALGGNWLRPLAASRWGGGSPPGSSELQDTEREKKSVTSDELQARRRQPVLFKNSNTGHPIIKQ